MSTSTIPTRALLLRFAQIFLPLALILSSIVFAVIRFDQHIRIQSAEVREDSRILVAKEGIQNDLAAVITDLRVLAKLPTLQAYLDQGEPAHRRELEQFFLLLAEQSKRYDQIRYLDMHGQERIRINDNDGVPYVVPDQQLQDKHGRYYFKDTLALDRGGIFMSPLDLNMERHRLQIPYKPMIRFGMPVYDSADDKKGVIVLNYLGQTLLNHFQNAMKGDLPHSGMLLNQDGYWLSSPNRTDEWGFMRDLPLRTFAHDHPQVWSVIAQADRGHLRTAQGLFVYNTIRPLQAVQDLVSQAISSTDDSARHPYEWKIVSFIPNASLFGSALYTHEFSAALLAVVFLLLAVLTLYLARITLIRQQAQREIIQLNQELEKRVIAHAAGEERLSVTLNSIGDAVLSTDVEGRIDRLNPVAEHLTGWSQAEAVGKPVAEVFRIINHHTRAPAPIPIWNTLALGTVHGLANDTVLIARDGTQRPIADSCAPIRNRQGAITGAILVFRDVTQEYAATQALIDSAKRIQDILNAVADGIITIDQHGVIETFNPAAERLFGYSTHEVIGRNVKLLMPEPDQSQHDDHIARYLASGEAHIIGLRREVEGLRKNGSRFPMHLAVNALRLSDATHFTGIMRDITDMKLNEQQLVAAKDSAEKANRMKDSFLATMSHEIRTPLTGLLGMLEVLSMSRLKADQTATLHAAWESARGLLRIVNDILDWSKIQEGRLILSPRPVSVQQVLQEVVNTYSRVASTKNLLLRSHVDPNLSAAHIVDPLRLSQVLNNFVSNAIKFTPEGEVVLRAELLDHMDSGERIRFSVCDTGIGIAEDVRAQLFQRYRQGSADTARLYGGTGLGLSICQRLAELLDGRIDLVSTPNKGSTFSLTLTLPVSAAPGERVPTIFPVVEQPKVEPLWRDGEIAPRVLAVDDHPINRDLLERQILLLGLRVVTAENGRTALAAWSSGHFALIITDCHMPEMDGYDFARAVRRIEAEQKRPRTPIIAWTANAGNEEQVRCENSGIDDLLVKPADLTQLKQTLARWLPAKAIVDVPPRTQDVPTQNTGTTTILDDAVLVKIVPDSAERKRLLLEFQRHMGNDVTKLGDVMADNDLVTATQFAHRMKGSCRMVGAIDLAETCLMIENAAQANDRVGALAGYARLKDALLHFDRVLKHTPGAQGEGA